MHRTFVGADGSVRPLSNHRFAATYHKKWACGVRVDVGIDSYKRIAYSHWRVRFCRCVPPGGQRRPPLQNVVRIYWCILRGRGRTLPLRRFRRFYEVADGVCGFVNAYRAIPQSPSATAPFTQGSLTRSARRSCVRVCIGACKLCICNLHGRGKPRPYGTMKRVTAQK